MHAAVAASMPRGTRPYEVMMSRHSHSCIPRCVCPQAAVHATKWRCMPASGFTTCPSQGCLHIFTAVCSCMVSECVPSRGCARHSGVRACKWLWLHAISIAESMIVRGCTHSDARHQAAVHACKWPCVITVSCTIECPVSQGNVEFNWTEIGSIISITKGSSNETRI